MIIVKMLFVVYGGNKRFLSVFLPLMCPDMLFQMVLAAELLATSGASVSPDTCMNELVSGQFLVAGEGFVALIEGAFEWSFAGVDPHVVG